MPSITDYGSMVSNFMQHAIPIGDVIPFGRRSLDQNLYGTEGARPYSGGANRVGSPQWVSQYEQQQGLRPGTVQPVERQADVRSLQNWKQYNPNVSRGPQTYSMSGNELKNAIDDAFAGRKSLKQSYMDYANSPSAKQVEQGIRNRTFSKAQIQDFLNNPVYQRTVAEAFSKLTPEERMAWARIME